MFAPRRRPATPGSGLHQCALCRAEAVVPVWWEAVDDERWHILLRCGECETYRDVSVPNDVARAYELDLDRGTAEIRAALARIDRDRMTLQADAFIVALQHDLIDAADFAAR